MIIFIVIIKVFKVEFNSWIQNILLFDFKMKGNLNLKIIEILSSFGFKKFLVELFVQIFDFYIII
jgi:hypothetical protein